MAVISTRGFSPSAALHCPAPAFAPHFFCTCQVSLAAHQTIKKSDASIPAVSPGSIVAVPTRRLPQQEELLAASKPVKDKNSNNTTCPTSFCVKACKCYKSLPNKQQAAGCSMQAIPLLIPKAVYHDRNIHPTVECGIPNSERP